MSGTPYSDASGKISRTVMHTNVGGTATPVSDVAPLPVGTELPAAALLADNTALPTTPIVGAALMGYDGATLDLLRTKGAGWQGVALVRSSDGSEAGVVSDSTDSLSPNFVLATQSRGALYNGATFDRQRGNTEGVLLASAARTATTLSATQTNHNARGVIIFLNVTVASGTGGLQVRFTAIDPVSGTGVSENLAPTAVTTTGLVPYVLYPGASGGNIPQSTAQPLPRTWAITVTHGDASSYTYSLGYSLIV